MDRPAFSIRDGRLHVEELACTELAARFGTPLYVMSETRLRSNVRRLGAALAAGWPLGEARLLPSIKANPTLATRAVLTSEGVGCDTFGETELEVALRAGVPPALISVNGASKSAALIGRAVAAGARITHETLAFVNLSVARDGDATTFRVHGGGFIIGRIANEFRIARTVATAIKDAYPSNGNADGCQRNLGPPCRNSRGRGDWRGDYDDYAGQDTANVAYTSARRGCLLSTRSWARAITSRSRPDARRTTGCPLGHSFHCTLSIVETITVPQELARLVFDGGHTRVQSVLLYDPVDGLIQQRQVLRYRLQVEPLELGPVLQACRTGPAGHAALRPYQVVLRVGELRRGLQGYRTCR